MSASRKLAVDFQRRRDLTPVRTERADITYRRLLEELARDGSPLEFADPKHKNDSAEFWMQKFLDHGVRPPLDVVRVYMAEYRRVWERLNRKPWSEREQKVVKKREHVRYICTAILAAQACGKANKGVEVNGKHLESARRLLDHFGIPGCYGLTLGAIEKTWKRFGKRVRPDNTLLDIFVYAQRKGLLS